MLRLLVLLAMLIMPLGMAPASAASHHDMASMPMQHCPEQAPTHHMKSAFAECTMACSAALPAADRIADSPFAVIGVPVSAGPAPLLHGLHPETATPPPRRA